MFSFWGLGIALALALAPLATTGPVIGATTAGTQPPRVAQVGAAPAEPVTLISLTDRAGEPTGIAVDGLLELAAAAEALADAGTSQDEPAPAVSPTTAPASPAVVTTVGLRMTVAEETPVPSQDELAGIAVLTPPIPTPEFLVAGVTWDAGELLAPDSHISMRVFEHGQWSQWLEIEADGAGFQGDSNGRAGTDPFVTGGSQAVQIQISGDPADLPPGLDLSLIPANPLPPTEAITQRPAEDAPAPPSDPIAPEHDDDEFAAPAAVTPVDRPVFSLASWTQPSSDDGSGVRYEFAAVDPRIVAPRPRITTREQWGADSAITTWTPYSYPLRAAIVHHTAGTNNYSAGQSAQVVRGIHYFHAVTRNWGDIGYNFLVDRYGQVFEGRKGTLQAGDAMMVQGAHARGYNSGTAGLSAMGDFTLQRAPQAILDSMADVIAWRFSLAGIDPSTPSGFISGGGTYRPSGQSLPRIFSHGEVAFTTCPSPDILGRIGGLRSAVDSRIRAAQAGRFSPFGSFDWVRGVPGGLSLRGWAIDPETDAPLYLWVTVDGVGRHILANSSRPDVARVYPSFSAHHGFDVVIPAAPGSRRVCVTAANVGLGDHRVLGCKSAEALGGSPVGELEDVRAVLGGIELSGWSLDPDTPSPVFLWVTIDGVGRHILADGARPELASTYPSYGTNHGFSARLDVGGGSRRVCVTASNTGYGSHTVLGCRQVTVPGGPPIGALENATAVPGGVDISGWALDPDTASSIYVWVTVDGAGRLMHANGTRPEVAQAHPGYGAEHGFSGRVSAGPGKRRVCVTGSNVGAGSHAELGCRDVTVLAGSPRGNFESVRAVRGGMEISGWAFDPDTTDSVYVWVTVDGRGRHIAVNQPRTDVGRVFPGYGDYRGFRETISAAPGLHRVCVTAANVLSGSHTGLSCRSVVVTD